jgi:uncharacterized protein (TIGR02611 family)
MVGGKAARRVALEVLGWTLVVVGVAALVLPGPGLLMLFAGLAVLSQQYTWAERRVRPVERAAKKAAADSVQTWPRVFASLLGVAWLVGLGIYWGLRPPAPDWWPLRDSWWLVGGWGTGATLIASAFIALAMIVYSFRKYRGLSEEEIVAEVEMSSRGNSTT